ncbi:MAG: DNA topoisomerase 3 [Butyrivibrio sp.]|nr:DNA topoisomerase 3 [Butyrivibrio sp.]
MKLVIAEKPSVAQTIAHVIGANSRKDGYMEGNGYIVSWCLGHLVSYAMPDAYGEVYAEKWTYESLPLIPQEWITLVNTETMQQYNVLNKLMHEDDVTSVICATDAGREGELIFRHVYNHSGCTKPIQRLWTDSLEEDAIRKGFETLKSGRDYENLYGAAVGRAKADWLIGMNCSRLFTVLYHAYPRLNVGRVQSPTLAMIVDRERQIKAFKKEPFYTAMLDLDGFCASSERFAKKPEADALASSCKGQSAVVAAVESENKTTKPPLLYDLTSLQRDANRIFGFTAQETLNHTQSLYEKKLCTYPRTDSKYLSDDMKQTALDVIAAVYDSTEYLQNHKMESMNIERVMDSSKVTDHHAIIPTVEIRKIDPEKIHQGEMKILELIKNRLICAVAENHLYTSTKVVFTCCDKEFTAHGKVVTALGWKAYDNLFKTTLKAAEDKDTESQDQDLPALEKGMTLPVKDSSVKEGSTQPPKHFTEDSLLSAMERAGADEIVEEVERAGLGTSATRAETIERLIKNGYVERQKKNLVSTGRGDNLIDILPDALKSPSLTADWENKLSLVSRGEFELEDFLLGIEEMVKSLVKTHSEADEEHKNAFSSPQEKETFGDCPHCGKPVLNGKYGAYCSGKCGMMFGYAFGVKLSASQVKSLIQGKKTLVKGCKGSNGKAFDAYLTPKGVKPYQGKDGKENFVFDFELEFMHKKGQK